MRAIFLLSFFLFLKSFIHGDSNIEGNDQSGENQDSNNPVIDRLAVNLAGAFAKSLLPERSISSTSSPQHMGLSQNFPSDSNPSEISTNIRRSPQTLPNLNMFQDQSPNLGYANSGYANLVNTQANPENLLQLAQNSGTQGIDAKLLELLSQRAVNQEIRRAPPPSNPFETAAGSVYSALNSFNPGQELSGLPSTGTSTSALNAANLNQLSQLSQIGLPASITNSATNFNPTLAGLASASPSAASLLNSYVNPLPINPYGGSDISNLRLPTNVQLPTSSLSSLGGNGLAGLQNLGSSIAGLSSLGRGLSGLSNLGSGLPGLSSLGNGLSTSQLSSLVSGIPGNLNIGSGGIDAINALRKQKYLVELQQHQHALNEYTAKQLDYLDKQARYQQAMINHHAGAALLMQQQQQDFLSKMKNKYSGLEEQKPIVTKTDFDDNQTAGRVFNRLHEPARQYAAKAAVKKAFEEQNETPEREKFASDAYLKQFFKENYDIEFPDEENLTTLSDEDKQTLRELKEHLIKEAQKDGKILKQGVFKTMEEFSEKRRSSKTYDEGENLDKELAKLDETECSKCVPIEKKKIRGAWTQIYGNPKVLKTTFSTIMTLMDMEELDEKRETIDMKPRHASCIGMEIGKFKSGQSKINIFFRDDSSQHELHEMKGTGNLFDDMVLKMSTSVYESKYCLVKAGPAEVPSYEYIVLAEITGENKCKSYHVFARDKDEFDRRHYDDIADFMKTEVLDYDALPVAALPKSEMCQVFRKPSGIDNARLMNELSVGG